MAQIKQINDNGVIYEIVDESARTMIAGKADSANVYDKSTIDSKLLEKSDKNDTYTKLETNEQINTTVNAKITDLIGSAPENLDTIQELAQAIENNQDAVTAINNAITNKADKSYVDDQLNTKANKLNPKFTGSISLDSANTTGEQYRLFINEQGSAEYQFSLQKYNASTGEKISDDAILNFKLDGLYFNSEKISGGGSGGSTEYKRDVITDIETVFNANTPGFIDPPNVNDYPTIFTLSVEYYDSSNYPGSWSGSCLIDKSGIVHSSVFFKNGSRISQCLFVFAGNRIICYPVDLDMTINKIVILYQ